MKGELMMCTTSRLLRCWLPVERVDFTTCTSKTAPCICIFIFVKTKKNALTLEFKSSMEMLISQSEKLITKPKIQNKLKGFLSDNS